MLVSMSVSVLAYKYEMADLLYSYDVEGYKSVAGTPALNGEPCQRFFITLTHCIFHLCINAATKCRDSTQRHLYTTVGF